MANVQPVTDAAITYGDQRAEEASAPLEAQIDDLQDQVADLTQQLADCEGSEQPPTPGEVVRRGYITQQVGSRNELTNYRDEFANAHDTIPAANALSIRFPYKVYDNDTGLLAVGYDMAQDEGLPFYSVRIMCGKHTPTNKMGRTLTEGGVTYPSPFGDTNGNPNNQFLDHLEETMRTWAAFLESTGEVNPILHWSWYAKEWAEIYHGPAVREAPGYTKQKFVAAQNAVIQRAADVQKDHPGVIMEFPMSGHGPISDIVDDMTQYAAQAFGDNRAAIQANGWSYKGQWGQSDPAVDEQMDACFDIAAAQSLGVGVQAIQPWGQNQTYPQYTASQVAGAFEQADAAGADYFELYTPSWLSGNGGAVWRDPIAEWLSGPTSVATRRRRLRVLANLLAPDYPNEVDPYYG